MRNPLMLWGAVFVSLLAVACSKPKPEEAEGIATVAVTAAVTQPVQRIITAEAILHPINQATVMPKISAPVKTFYVNRGDHVRQGQLLAILENRDLQASTVENQGLYRQAQSTLRATTSATLPEEVTKSKADAAAAKEALDAAQKVYESRRSLFQQGAIARRLVDEAAVSLAQAKSTYDTAQAHLTSFQNVGRQEQVNNAQAQVDAARGRYQGAEAQLAYSRVTSPITGVVSERPIYPGEMASAGAPLITIMDVSRVVARATITEKEAVLLKVGDAATITAGNGGEQVPGKITVVSPALDPSSTTVEVWIQAANPGGQLKPGATVHVSIIAATIPDAIVVPSSAVLPGSEGGDSVLVVTPDSMAHEHKVEVGVRQGDLVQIVSGVRSGERVVTEGGLGIADKTKVNVEKQESGQAAPEKSE